MTLDATLFEDLLGSRWERFRAACHHLQPELGEAAAFEAIAAALPRAVYAAQLVRWLGTSPLVGRATALLDRILCDPLADTMWTLFAAEALAAIDDPEADALRARLLEDPVAGDHVALGLGRRGDARAAPRLLAAFERTGSTYYAMALGGLPPEKVRKPVAEALARKLLTMVEEEQSQLDRARAESTDPDDRTTFLSSTLRETLASLRHPATVAVLSRGMRSPEARQALAGSPGALSVAASDPAGSEPPRNAVAAQRATTKALPDLIRSLKTAVRFADPTDWPALDVARLADAEQTIAAFLGAAVKRAAVETTPAARETRWMETLLDCLSPRMRQTFARELELLASGDLVAAGASRDTWWIEPAGLVPIYAGIDAAAARDAWVRAVTRLGRAADDPELADQADDLLSFVLLHFGGRKGRGFADRCEEKLGSLYAESRLQGVRLLAGLGAAAALPTVSWLAETDPDPEVRSEAIGARERLAPGDGVPRPAS